MVKENNNKIYCICGGEMKLIGAERVAEFTVTQIKQFGLEPDSEQLKNLVRLNTTLIVGPLGAWKCIKCGKTEGGYSAMGRNMIKVEPLEEVK